MQPNNKLFPQKPGINKGFAFLVNSSENIRSLYF